MRIVDDWKQAYKWLSVHAFALIGVVNAIEATVTAMTNQGLSIAHLAVLNSVLAAAGIWLRLLRQGGSDVQ